MFRDIPVDIVSHQREPERTFYAINKGQRDEKKIIYLNNVFIKAKYVGFIVIQLCRRTRQASFWHPSSKALQSASEERKQTTRWMMGSCESVDYYKQEFQWWRLSFVCKWLSEVVQQLTKEFLWIKLMSFKIKLSPETIYLVMRIS